MSLKIESVTLNPSVTVAQGLVYISAVVYDESFEFDSSAYVYDERQGFANEAQTIGGKLA